MVVLGERGEVALAALVERRAGAQSLREQARSSRLGAANAKNVNAQLKLFWIGVGTEDGAMVGAKRTSDFLTSAGIKHTYETMPGAHTWIVRRKYLNEVAPQVFPAARSEN